MTSIFDVAKYILNKKGTITSWELQKLCYYCKAWSLALGEGEMFPEKFEAWKDGPACRTLFAEHRGNFQVNSLDISKGSVENISPNSLDIINAVLDVYKSMDGEMLREQTHSEKPWIIARNGLSDNEICNTVIDDNLMRKYYRNSSMFDNIDDLVLEHRAIRRINTKNEKTYSLLEVVNMLGLTVEDIANAEDVDIES